MPPKKQPPKLVTLNDEQKAVVNLRHGHFAVMAGPGSGKSQCISVRYSRLIQEGISPNQILSLSFTSAAAKNLKERVASLVGPLSISRTAGAMTFHGMALAFATQEAHEFPFKLAEFPLCPEPIALKLSGESARRYEIDPRSLRPWVSLQKRHRVSPAAAIRSSETNGKDVKLALAYKDYERKTRGEGVLDFDSLLFEMVELLEKKPEVKERWSYLYCMADEAQDCSQIEWDLLRLLSEKCGNLLTVGDAGQGVYGFRGSDPKLFLNMEEMFSGTKKFYLGQNYRSSPELVKFIKSIGPVKELAEHFHTSNLSGPEPVIIGFQTSHQEAEFVVNKILEGYENQP